MARVIEWLPRVVIVAALAGTVTGLVLVDRVGDRYEAALGITVEAAEIVADASGPISSLPDDVAAVAESVDDALVEVRDVVGTASTSIEAIAVALRTNLAESVAATAATADRAAGVVEDIERFIPGNVESFAEDLRGIADGLEPTPVQLRALADQLDTAVGDLEDTAVALGGVQDQLGLVADRLAEASGAVDDLPTVAERLRGEARAAEDDLESDLWWMRLGVVLLGLTLALLGVAIESVRAQLAAHTNAAVSDPVAPGP